MGTLNSGLRNAILGKVIGVFSDQSGVMVVPGRLFEDLESFGAREEFVYRP